MTPDRPTDRDQQQAAELAQDVRLAMAPPMPSGNRAEARIVAALAAAHLQGAVAALEAAAAEQRAEAGNVPDTDEGTHADGHRCAADFLDRRAARLRAQQ